MLLQGGKFDIWTYTKKSSLIRLDFLVEIVGVEPTTPCLQSRCSSQLSYTPMILKNLVLGRGIEPLLQD